MSTAVFDPVRYEETTREQWQAAAQAWNEWESFLRAWLGPATELMLDMAEVGVGDRVLDVAAGAGDQILQIAGSVGQEGHVLATDISSALGGCAGNHPFAGRLLSFPNLPFGWNSLPRTQSQAALH